MLSSAEEVDQENIRTLLKQANELRYSEPQKALKLNEQAYKQAEESQDKDLYFDVLLGLAVAKATLGDFQEAFSLAHQATQIKLTAALQYLVAKMYLELGESTQALEKFLLTLDLLKKTPDQKILLSCLMDIARLHHNKGDFDLELNAYKEAIAYLLPNDDLQLAIMHNNIAMAYKGLANHKQALKYAKKARALAETLTDQPFLISTIVTIGEIYVAALEPQKALRYLENSLSKAQHLKLEQLQVFCHKSIAESYLMLDKTAEAISALETALELAKKNKQKIELSNCLKLLAQAYKQSQQFEKALTYFEQHHEQNMQLFNAKATRNLQQLHVLHETQKTKARADELEKQVQARTHALERTHIDMLDRLSRVSRHRDFETSEHTQRVGIMAARVAEMLGCDDAFVRSLALAARLHDMGKIGIPDKILLKQGSLTTAEFELIKRHTVMGANMLSGSKSELMTMAYWVALSHHERWDGSGYPRGLAGKKIPLVGRIVAVVDTFDALVNDRPYKKAWSKSKALTEIKEQSGKMFDPQVVEVFLDLMRLEKG